MVGGYAFRRLLRRAALHGANKAAVRLAKLGRPVKEMIGGVAGWIDEGFELVAGSDSDDLAKV